MNTTERKKPIAVTILLSVLLSAFGSVLFVSAVYQINTRVQTQQYAWESEVLPYVSLPYITTINFHDDDDVLNAFTVWKNAGVNQTSFPTSPYGRIFGSGSVNDPYVIRYVTISSNYYNFMLSYLTGYYIFDHVRVDLASGMQANGYKMEIKVCNSIRIQNCYFENAFDCAMVNDLVLYNNKMNFINSPQSRFYECNFTEIKNLVIDTMIIESSDILTEYRFNCSQIDSLYINGVEDPNQTKRGLWVDRVKDGEIRNSIFQGYEEGIRITNSENIILTANDIICHKSVDTILEVGLNLTAIQNIKINTIIIQQFDGGILCENISNYEITDGTIVYAQHFGILLNVTENGRLDDIYISCSNYFDIPIQYGIRCISYSWNIEINNVRFFDMPIGIHMRSLEANPYNKQGFGNISVNNCRFDMHTIAINVTGYNIQIWNNYIEDTQNGILAENVPRIKILLNEIVGIGSGFGIHVDNTEDYGSISGNIISNTGYGIYVNVLNYGNISTNKISNVLNYGIWITRMTYSNCSDNQISFTKLNLYLQRVTDSRITNNVIWNSTTYGIQTNDYISRNIFYNNTLLNNTYFGLLFTPNSDHNKIWLNTLANNNVTSGQAWDNGVDNEWDNGSYGNYWDDFKIRYPSATFNTIFWNGEYRINGSAFALDRHPLVYNYAFRMNYPPDMIIPYSEANLDHNIGWNIDRKTMNIDLDWRLEVSIMGEAWQVCDSGTLNTDPRFAGKENFNMIFNIRTYLASDGIVPINNYTFCLTIEYLPEELSINDTINVYLLNTEITITKSNNLLFSADDGSQTLFFQIIDPDISTNARYSLYRNAIILEQNQIWVSNQIVTIQIGFISNGEYDFKMIATDGYGSIKEAIVHVSVTPEKINIAPIIERIQPITYQENSIDNEITIRIRDNRTWYPEYNVYINDDLISRGSWISTQPFTLNIDGYDVGTYTIRIIAYDGYGLSSEQQITFIVYEGFNPPPIIQNDIDTYYLLEQQISVNTLRYEFEWIVVDPVVFLPTYEIIVNEKSVAIGQWYSGLVIRELLFASNFNIGKNTVILSVNDGYGLTDQLVMTVEVVYASEVTAIIWIGSIVGGIGLVALIMYLLYRRNCQQGLNPAMFLCRFQPK